MKFKKATMQERMQRIVSLYRTLQAQERNTEREIAFMKRVESNLINREGEFRPLLCSSTTRNSLYRETYKFRMKRVPVEA